MAGQNWPVGVRSDMPAVVQNFSTAGLWKRRAGSTALSPANTTGILVLMSDVVPITAWLTYQQLAERLGLRSASAAASRARRGNGPAEPETTRWRRKSASRPKCLPPARGKPRERRAPAGPAADAITVGDAVAAAVAPLQTVIERLSGELAAARAANEALRDQLAAAQSEAAELPGKSAANEAALEREVTDRRAVQQQADHSCREHQAAQERVAKAQVSLREQQARLRPLKT